MFESKASKSEDERPIESIDEVLLDAIRGVIYEPHEQHVEYEDFDRGQSQQGGSGDSSGGGGGMLPMLLVGVALGAIGYLYGKRSGSGGGSSQTLGKAANRTEEIAGGTAETVRETGQKFSERTEETASQASERIEETTEQVGDQIEEGGTKAADEMDDKS